MQHMRPATVAVAFWILASSVMLGQAQSLSITNYQVVSQFGSNVTYRADLANPGPALTAVTATLTSLDPFSFRVVAGQNTLNFQPVPANTQVTSQNTFTVYLINASTLDPSKLQWTFQTTAGGPVANPGSNQTVAVGSTVTLNGSGSTNPSGVGTLSYSWQFTSIPAGSTAFLGHSGTVMPSFVVDVPGTYIIALTVSNGVASGTASVTVSTFKTAPVANAGPGQSTTVGSTVQLNGSGSTSVDGRQLTYAWTLTTRPSGSTAVLTGANTVSPTFVADKAGNYVAQLIVNDGLPSNPSTVTITTGGTTPPIANAGPNQSVLLNALVQLTGAGSTDANGLPLTYQWSIVSLPAGSAATLSNPTAVNPTFTADQIGIFVVQLIVNDGVLSSTPVTVPITTESPLAPTANAGVNQTVKVGSTVQLSGTGTDPQSLPLTYQWALISKPAGSAAALSSAVIANPTFIADLPGTYLVQLMVTNSSSLSSALSTVMIGTTCGQPTANPGVSQNVSIGATVTLNGSGSGDACQDPMTYSWSFTTRPAGSAATLSGATTVSPTFVADVAGTYVVQLIVNNSYASSTPVTVTITALTGSTIVFQPGLVSLTGGAGSALLILPFAAGSGGQVVNLGSNNTNVATVPATVTVPAGQMGTTVTVTAGTVSGTTTITATASGALSGALTVTNTLPSIALTLNSSVGVAGTINGVVTLSSAASSSTTITLSANPSGIVTVQPTSVVIGVGNISGAFTVTGVSVGSTTISAASPGYNPTSGTVTVVSQGTITLPSNVTVGPSQSVSFPVTLALAAPPSGVTVTLATSDSSKVTISPSTVFIPFRSTTPDVQPQITGVNFGTATITASAPGFTSDSKVVQVAATMSFSPASATIYGGVPQTLTLNLLSGTAPAGGLTVNLVSSAPGVATVPATVTIPAGLSSATVVVTGVAVGSATITASTANIANATASVSVQSPQITLPANVSVTGGQSAAFPVTLPIPAPTGGVTITLTSSDTTKVTVSPSTVFIPLGGSSSTQPQVTGVSIGSATITASAPGWTSATQVVTVPGTLSFSPTTLAINASVTQNLSLCLSATAASGLTINLASGNTGVAIVPATVNIAAGGTCVAVPVTGEGGGSTTITANATGIVGATASVTVTSVGTISLPASAALTVGQSTTVSVTLSPAPSTALTVLLASSDTSKATVSPASITIAAGATSGTATVTGVGGGSATITASSTGWAPGNMTAQVTAQAISFPTSSVTISGTQNLTLNLSGAAPAGGLTIALSSSNTSVITVPATVMFAAGSTSTNFSVAGVGPGTATITASATGFAPATISVTVTGDIGLPANVVLSPGNSAQFPVTLGKAAASGGVFITLTSSDPSKVTVTPGSILIPQGSTTYSFTKVTGVAIGSATITATAYGLTPASQVVQVTSNGVSSGSSSFSPTSLSITGTATQNLTLTLSAPATAGLTATLSSGNTSVATVPATVTFAANATSATVPVTGVASGSTTITATVSGFDSATANVTVSTSSSSAGIVVPANTSVPPGQTVPFPVTLSAPAPSGGVFITLTSSDTTKVAILPTNILILTGATAPTSVPQVTGIAAGSAIISAVATGYSTVNGQVQVVSTTSLGLLPANLSITGTATQNLTLTLPAAASSSGQIVNLVSSNSGVATVPATVTVPAALNSVSVPVTGVAPGSATITASMSGVGSATANITVVGSAAINLPSGVTLSPGDTVNFPVTLATAAPSGGVFMTLTNSAPTVLTLSPATLFFAEGATTSSVTPKITGVTLGSATITASAPSIGSASQQVVVSATLGFQPASLVITGITLKSLTLSLSAPAPAGGLTINLSSSDTTVATVPSTVTIPANSTSVNVVVTSVGPGTATIDASALPTLAATTATVTVVSAPSVILPAFDSVGVTWTVQIPVSLSTPAPAGGVTVTLTSSDTSKFTVTPSVFIAAGATTPATQPSVTAGNSFASEGYATLTASASGYTTASLTMHISDMITIALPDNLKAEVGLTTPLPIALPGPAPAGGVLITLTSSNPSVVNVSLNTFIPAGSNVPTTLPLMTGVNFGTAVISATASNYISGVQTVTATTQLSVSPSSLAISGSATGTLTLSISGPAPAGGLTVNLLSSNSGVASVPASVFFQQNATSVSIPVSGSGTGSATITAVPGVSGVPSTIATVNRT